jgi:hypothetical protein
MNKSLNNWNTSRNRSGIVLLVTLVLLVVLSTLGYTLTSRVTAQRHRDQYIIDYSKARYGCDSAVKYALTSLEEIEPQLISRPNEPDFSDLFALDEAGHQEILAQWDIQSLPVMYDDTKTSGDESDSNDVNKMDKSDDFYYTDSVFIRGPYGPPWPFITEPEEFDISSVNVRIEIEDENAKYPLGWALLDDPELEREIDAGFVTFCEMNGLDGEQIESLRLELNQIGQIKPFKLDFKPITSVTRTPTRPGNVRTRNTTRKTRTSRVQRKVITVPKQISEQTMHFARLFHSSLIDTEALARPNIIAGDRKESALKYTGTWGSQKVNINTAPRHVLEAAFIFGGNEVEIAEEIIRRRREEPFADTADLKNALARYSGSITKCEKYITTKSTLFTIRITAISGVAKASSVIAVTKNGKNITRIAVINS